MSNAVAQAVVKNFWSDGSARFAVVSGTADLAAGVAKAVSLSAGSAISGTLLTTADLQATGVTASIATTNFGSASWSGADWASPFVTWVSGPRMSSWIYRKPIGSDSHLVGWLEVRLYAGGAVEVLPWVENGYLTVAGGTNKSSSYAFTLGGSQRFSSNINLLGRQRTPLVSGSALSHWLGSDPGVVVKHDTAYLMSTRMVPTYSATVPPSAGVVTKLPSAFTPLQQGGYPSSMGDTGYDASIGLLPEWDVLYLTSTASTVWAALQRNAYSAGRYGLYVRDQATNLPVQFAQHPNLVYDGTSGVTDVGSSQTGTYVAPVSGGSAPTYKNSHCPAFGYLAYLVTGRYFHLETLQFQAGVHYLKQTSSYRLQSQGVLISDAGSNQVRGAAWALRTLAQAVAVTPLDNPLHDDLLASFEANVSWYHAGYVAKANNPQGLVENYDDQSGSGSDGRYALQIWMQDFFTAALGMAKSFGLPLSATGDTRLTELFAWKARSVIGRLGGTGVTEYLYRDAAQYLMTAAPSDNPNWSAGTGPWYTDWGQVYQATMGAQNPGVAGDLRGGYFPDATSYWGNLQPAIAYAVEHGVAGASAAYARMTGASNWSQFLTSANGAPVWAVRPPG